MSYVEPGRDRVTESTVINPVVDYHDRVRWGPIFAGIVVAIATQLILSALGAAVGLTIGAGGGNAGDIGLGVGIWSIISLLIALFAGGWVTASSCGPMNSKTALLHGLILWATTLAISSWLLASGVSGTFGLAVSSASQAAGAVADQVPAGGVNVPQQQIPNVQGTEVAATSAKVAWSFLIGSLLALAAALIGTSVGKRKPRVQAPRTSTV